AGAGGHVRGRGVAPERAAGAVLAVRALDGRKLDAEILPGQRAPRLLGPAEIVHLVEGDEVEHGLRPGPGGHDQDQRGGGDEDPHGPTLSDPEVPEVPWLSTRSAQSCRAPERHPRNGGRRDEASTDEPS